MSSRALRVAAVPAMLAAGGMIAVQSEINGRLAVQLGTGLRAGVAAAAISFGSGLVLVAAIAALMPSARAGMRAIVAARRTQELPRRVMLGGALGAFLVATQGVTVSLIGVAVFSVGLTAGMAANALAVDHFGWGPSGRTRPSPPRVVAAAFAVTAVVLAAGERLVQEFSWHTALLLVLPVLAGAGSAVQQAFNGRVSAVGGPWATTVNNFVVGLSALVVCLVASFALPGDLDALPRDWWLYIGGAMGVAFICLAALLVKVHGVLVLSLSMIVGQVVVAELIELLGHSHIGPAGIAAGVLTIAGVTIAVLLRPHPA